jgi:hypothetical protein
VTDEREQLLGLYRLERQAEADVRLLERRLRELGEIRFEDWLGPRAARG